MAERTYNVLFLCTGNSARSIMAEAYLNHVGQGGFQAHSAGSRPKNDVNPLALSTLHSHGVPCHGARSKSWDEFAERAAPRMDLVITVCDSAAAKSCPIWPGAPLRAHWSFPDPTDAPSFERVFAAIRSAVDRLVATSFDGDPVAVGRRISSLVTA